MKLQLQQYTTGYRFAYYSDQVKVYYLKIKWKNPRLALCSGCEIGSGRI